MVDARHVRRRAGIEIEDYGDLFLRGVHLLHEGDVHDGHRHYFDHLTLLTHGAVRIEWRDEDGTTGLAEHDATSGDVLIRISASRWHRITATKDDTQWWCIFAVRDAAGKLIDRPEETDPKHHYMAERPED